MKRHSKGWANSYLQDHGDNVDLFPANPREQDFSQAGRAGEGRHDHAGQGERCIEYRAAHMNQLLAGN